MNAPQLHGAAHIFASQPFWLRNHGAGCVTVKPPERISRIVYLGTPDFAVAPLRALHNAGYEIVLVVSRADKRRGRGRSTAPSPVKAAALELGLAVTDNLERLADTNADLGVVIAYGEIIGEDLLNRLAFVNTHFSLLPRWRGAAPIQRAILEGDDRTGVCLIEVTPELDSGGIYRCDEVTIDPDETHVQLRRSLVEVGTRQLIAALSNGFGDPVPQVGEPVYAAKISAGERELDWNESTERIHRRVRVGRAYTEFRGRRLLIHRTSRDGLGSAPLSQKLPAPGELDGVIVGTGDGILKLIEVQPEGRPRLNAVDWHKGARPTNVDRLGKSD